MVKSVDDLHKPGLPSQADFYSSLCGLTISADDYEMARHAWTVNGMQKLLDLLKWYSLLDVRPRFLEAVLVYLNQYKNRGLDLFMSAISLPEISLNWAFDTLARENKFHLFPPSLVVIGALMRRNLTGGLSIIFHCKHVKNETLIRNNPAHVVKSIVGYDANALYLWCTAQNMPIGQSRVFRLNKGQKLQQVFDPDVNEKNRICG